MTETKVVKVTKRMNINSLLARTDLTTDEREYLLHELELIDKKNAYKSKVSEEKKAQLEEVKNAIVDILTDSSPKTCSVIASEISKIFNTCYSPQKIQPQLKALKEQEIVENFKEKGVSLYKLAE